LLKSMGRAPLHHEALRVEGWSSGPSAPPSPAAGLGQLPGHRSRRHPLDPEVYYIANLPVLVDPGQFALVALASMVLAWLATVYPASKAARLDPVEGRGANERRRWSRSSLVKTYLMEDRPPAGRRRVEVLRGIDLDIQAGELVPHRLFRRGQEHLPARGGDARQHHRRRGRFERAGRLRARRGGAGALRNQTVGSSSRATTSCRVHRPGERHDAALIPARRPTRGPQARRGGAGLVGSASGWTQAGRALRGRAAAGGAGAGAVPGAAAAPGRRAHRGTSIADRGGIHALLSTSTGGSAHRGGGDPQRAAGATLPRRRVRLIAGRLPEAGGYPFEIRPVCSHARGLREAASSTSRPRRPAVVRARCRPGPRRATVKAVEVEGTAAWRWTPSSGPLHPAGRFRGRGPHPGRCAGGDEARLLRRRQHRGQGPASAPPWW